LASYNSNKTVLVTGGSGQVGSELKLISQISGINFFFPSSDEFNLLVTEDIMDYCNRIKPDLIINLAAYTDVDNAEVEKEKSSLINHHAVSQLGKYSFENNIGLIHFSTDYVFGNNKGPHKHNDLKSPINHYGLTKDSSENDLIKINSRSLTIRLASVFSDKGKNFVKTMTNLILDSKEINVVSDQKISLTYAGDVASLTILLSNSFFLNNSFNFIKGGLFHFTNAGYTDWFSVARLIQSEVNKLGSDNESKLHAITSKEWSAKAIRPNDSRLVVDNNWLNSKGMVIPSWEDRVKKVVSSILVNKKMEL